MGSTIPDLDAAMKAAMASLDALEARMATNIHNLVVMADARLKALTPVYTGQSVRNYVWTTGAPNATVYEAIDNGPTGHTSSMSLGQEPRRAVNEQAAEQSLLALDMTNPFQVFYCTNNSPAITGLEQGILPGAPLSSRSPGGMFNIVDKEMSIYVAAKGII